MNLMLKQSDRYVLRDSNDEYVVKIHPEITTTKNLDEARRFSGDYLNTTVWEWAKWYNAVEV